MKQRRQAATRVMKTLRKVVACDCIRDIRRVFTLTIVPSSTIYHNPPDVKCIFRIRHSIMIEIMESIIRASVEYLQWAVNATMPSIEHLPYYYNDCKRMIEKFIHDANSTDEEVAPHTSGTLLNTVMAQQFDFQRQDAFTYYQVNGLIALCSKPDLCGFYSRGNALDIIQLFELIRPFLKSSNLSVYNHIYGLPNGYKYTVYDVFELCANTPDTRVYGNVIDE